MLIYNVFGFYALVLFYTKSTVICQESNRRTKASDNAVHHSFVKLLKSIVKVNEERMDAVKKIAQLQDYMITKNRLKPDEDSFDSEEEEESHTIFAIEDPPKLRRTEDEIVTLKLCSKLLLKNNVRLWSNDFFKHACPVRSTESCVDACVKAFLNICENFTCKPGIKSNFKTECKTSCMNLFEHDEE